MTDVLCKACGNHLGEIADYEPGDYTTCDECGIGYNFRENPNKQASYEELIESYANEGETHEEAFARLAESDQTLEDLRAEVDTETFPLMITDPDTVPAREGSEVAEVLSVTEQEDEETGTTYEVVTYLREDGVRVKDYRSNFDGEIPEELENE